MNETKRTYIYQETYDEVYEWAKEQSEYYDARGENFKLLHNNFPSALAKYIEHLKKFGGENGKNTI